MTKDSKKTYTQKEYNRAVNEGIDIGKSIAEYETAEAARTAYTNGTIEWWLEKMRAKTLKEWEQWVEDNGELDSLS
jgi:hypothetical protein